MEGSFNLNEPGYYTVKDVAEIEGFDKDQYGNTWYNVIFQGDAETFMWLKKDLPVEGQKYYGHLEPTKSGKRIRFKTDKVPEAPHQASQVSNVSSSSRGDKYLKDTSDIPRSLVIELLKYYDVQSLYNSPKYTQMIQLAQSLNDDITKMIESNRSGSGGETILPSTPQIKESEGETPKAAANQGRLRSAWEERKDLPKAVSWNDEPMPTEEDMPYDQS